MAWKLHAVEQTQLRRQHRVDGVGRPKIDSTQVDEADSILVDEARTPLIISGEGDDDAPQKYDAATLAASYLEKGRDYEVDYKGRRVTLTDNGFATAADLLGVADDPLGLFGTDTKWAAYLFPALNAKELYFRERDYLVDQGEVKIVDEFTGRVMEGRRWNGGLHQAVEAKEKVDVKPEQVTVASITYQSLFLLYPTLSGMTGTAFSEAKELSDTYLPVWKSTSASGARPCWLRRVVRNRHRHAIEQASRRWRGGRTRREI